MGQGLPWVLMSRDGEGAPVLVLASASPRRLDLLRTIGLEPMVVPADVDETPVLGEKPQDLVARLAATKAGHVAENRELPANALIVAADTVIDIDGDVFAKPVDTADAARMLRALAGRSHRVVTGMAVVERSADGTRSEVLVDATEVWLRPYGEHEIEWYIDSGEPMGKAGAYAIQGIGSLLVERISGSYQNVVGLSLPALDELVSRLGLTLRTL